LALVLADICYPLSVIRILAKFHISASTRPLLVLVMIYAGTRPSRRRETREMILASSGRERLTRTQRSNRPDLTLLTWMKTVGSACPVEG